MTENSFGLNLTGGGARGSYQAGALLALAEILKEQDLTGESNPFHYWSGVSAGSINATFCAAGVDDLSVATKNLEKLWSQIEPEQVYKTDFKSMTKNGARWISDLTVGPVFKQRLARSVFETDPLLELLKRKINFLRITENLKNGYLKGLACSAYSYMDNRDVTFLETNRNVSWDKPKRYSKKLKITAEHVMASCAIPVLFPTIPIDGEYFADGGFRNTAPISPMIHMGAKKILMIGVRGPNEFSDKKYNSEPHIAKIAGVILNALFFDNLDVDVERMGHMNEIIQSLQKDIVTKRSDYTKMDYKLIRPSRDISRIAEQNAKNFPNMIALMLRGLGSHSESAELASYILFVPSFTKTLIELGYHDVMAQKHDLVNWMSHQSA